MPGAHRPRHEGCTGILACLVASRADTRGQSAAVSLPSQDEALERSAVTRRVVGDFCRSRSEDPLAHIMWLLAAKLEPRSGAEGHVPQAGRTASAARRLAKDLRQRARPTRPDFFSGGDVLFVVESENQRRVLAPVAASLGATMRPVAGAVAWREQRRLSAHALCLARELSADLSAAGAAPPIAARTWYAFARDAGHAFGYARALFREGTIRAAAVASTHGGPPRALVAAAREAGVPSVYTPHAPLLRDLEVIDLPVDYAALRGSGEVEHYAGFGVERRLLAVAGDPSMARPAEPPPLARGLDAVFAPSPDPQPRIAAMVAVIAAATSEPVTVSPHPRSDVDFLRQVMPHSWSVWQRRTLELLEQGPPVVVQHSSGVALEALQLGLPTVELTFPGGRPAYPFIREPYVVPASNSVELRAALEQAHTTDSSRRDELLKWARHWVARTGDDAAAHIGALIDEAKRVGPRAQPIWDAWAAKRSADAAEPL